MSEHLRACLASTMILLYSDSIGRIGASSELRIGDIASTLPENACASHTAQPGQIPQQECNCDEIVVPLRPDNLPNELAADIHEWVTIGSMALGRSSGRWYYEFRYGRGTKSTQVGWVSSHFLLTKTFDLWGTGDDEYSFAADAHRNCKRNGHGKPQLVPFIAGELLGSVIGCAIDIDRGKLWFYMNGKRVESSHLYIDKTKMPNGTTFFPAVSSRGTFTFVFGLYDMLFPETLKEDELQVLSTCPICECPWPPKRASRHICGANPDSLTVRNDGRVIAQALRSLAPNRCGNEWDCSELGVFKIDRFILGCEPAIEANVSIASPSHDCAVFQQILRDELKGNLQEHVGQRLWKTANMSIHVDRKIRVEMRLRPYMILYGAMCKVAFGIKVLMVSFSQISALPEAFNGAVKDGILAAMSNSSLKDRLKLTDISIDIQNGGRVSHLNWFQLGLSGQIPTILGQLPRLKVILLHQNRLTGPIPTELGKLKLVTDMFLLDNELKGLIPSEIFSISNVEFFLRLDGNCLSGSIPSEIGRSALIDSLYLKDNDLTGEIPTEIGRLTELYVMWFEGNKLEGSIPSRIGYARLLSSIKFGGNRLQGQIPDDVGRLTNSKVLLMSDNFISGSIPDAMFRCQRFLKVEYSNNSLTGEIPQDLYWKDLTVFDIHENRFQGQIPTALGRHSFLYYINLGLNNFIGHVPSELGNLESIQNLWMTKNSLFGQIPSELGRLAQMTNLFVFRNRFTGQLPKSFCQLTQMRSLWMASNDLTGWIPDCYSNMNKLKYVLLSSNRLSGPIPKSLVNLTRVRALTLNDNRLTGHFSSQGLRMRRKSWPHEVVLMLQRNELSCKLPEYIMDNDSHRYTSAPAHILVVLGNMFDSPMPAWVRSEEQKSELLYNSHPGLDVIIWTLVCPVAFAISLCIWWLLVGRDFWKTVFSVVFASTEHSLVNLYRGLLWSCAVVSVIPSLLVLLYWFGSGYYECGQVLARASAAYFKSSPMAEWFVTLLWCTWLLFTSLLALIIPAYIPGSYEDEIGTRLEMRTLTQWTYAVFGHVAWLGAMIIISWPSLMYGIAKTLHDDNAIFFGKFKQESRRFVFYLAPATQTVMESLIAPNFAHHYSRFFGCSQWALLVISRAVTTWVVSWASSIILAENCMGGWKWFWLVCATNSKELDFKLVLRSPIGFLYHDTVIKVTDTTKHICRAGKDWMWYSRCDRTILEYLAPYLTMRLAVAAHGLPLAYLWRYKYLHSDPNYLLKRQMLGMTAVLQVTIIWVPFIPILMPLIACAVTLHLVSCYYCTSNADVKVENPNPAWMISITLKPSVAFVSALMLHFAWVTDMHGRCFLTGFVALGAPAVYYANGRLARLKRKEGDAGASDKPIWVELATTVKASRVILDVSSPKRFNSQEETSSRRRNDPISGSCLVTTA